MGTESLKGRSKKFPIEGIDANWVIQEWRRRLSDSAYPLWRRLESERKERGVPAVISYLRAVLDNQATRAEKKLKSANEDFEREMRG